MTRRFLVATALLSAVVAFLVGLVVAGTMTPATAVSGPPDDRQRPLRAAVSPAGVVPAVSFAEIAERLNPAVVTIDAASRGGVGDPRRALADPTDGEPRGLDGRRLGTGTGFVIDRDGHILTNHHVVEGADRILVRLADGRTLRAAAVGADPDSDIALIRVDASEPLPVAPMGDSDTLRVGEWVVAIGNPLNYEHTVTVGVVSFIGRKLFDSSLDRYIQTDAAINFGNSGGPLINVRGEVIGINAAISSRASNIGFAVPINQARAILPQLRATGRVARGYIGVMLRDVDADLQRALRLPSADGALVQDVTPGSPGARAGLRPYDVIISVDGAPVDGNDALVGLIGARAPGSSATVHIVRDGRSMDVALKLAERPQRGRAVASRSDVTPRPDWPLGLSVRGIDERLAARYGLPRDAGGVIVAAVEPMSAAFDADIARGHLVLEIDRQPVRTVDDFRRLSERARPGDVLTIYVYKPELNQRALETLTVDRP